MRRAVCMGEKAPGFGQGTGWGSLMGQLDRAACAGARFRVKKLELRGTRGSGTRIGRFRVLLSRFLAMRGREGAFCQALPCSVHGMADVVRKREPLDSFASKLAAGFERKAVEQEAGRLRSRQGAYAADRKATQSYSGKQSVACRLAERILY